MKNKKGISLIVLVITILVMIILAGVVVVTMQDNNPIEKSKTSTDVTNLATLKEELDMYKADVAMQGGNAESITAKEDKVKDVIKNIPGKLQGKICVVDGKLGVYYSTLTEDAREYAREHNIFDAEDKIVPDADIYIENRGAKKYICVDAIDYETDIAKITCSNGEEKIPDRNYEKIVMAYDACKAGKSGTDMEKELSKRFANVSYLDSANITKDKCNVLVNYGAQFTAFGKSREANGEWLQNIYKEQNAIDLYNKGTAKDKMLVVTLGNDTSSRIDGNPLIKKVKPETIKNFAFSNKLVDNIVTRRIEKVAKENPNLFRDDTREIVQFQDLPQVTKLFTNAAVSVNSDCAAVIEDKENGRTWIHLHEAGVNTKKEEIQKVADIVKSMVTKYTGSRSMYIDVTNVPAGSKYTFAVTDFAGNTLPLEISI